MANLSSQKYSNIARPYAHAAFEYARDNQQLLAWKNFLESASKIATNPSVVELLTYSELSSAKLVDLFKGVLSSLMNVEQTNFLLLLAQNKRLMMLPAITDLFKAYYAAYEKMSSVRLVTAVEISDDYKQKITTALSKRVKREISLNCEINPAIIGGAIIHIGDSVIDGSIRGKLTRLLQNLTG